MATTNLQRPQVDVRYVSELLSGEALRLATMRLTAEERTRAARFVFERDRRLFVTAHWGLRVLLAQRMGVDPSALRFDTNPYGKPSCRTDPTVAFNLSHSGNVVLLGFSQAIDVGVDVELVRPFPDMMAFASQFFSLGERRALLRLDGEARQTGFFRCWTRKEAYVKATGKGLTTKLSRFEVTVGPHPVLRSVEGNAAAAQGWSLHDIDLGPDHLACVAVSSESVDLDVEQVRIADLHANL